MKSKTSFFKLLPLAAVLILTYCFCRRQKPAYTNREV